MTKVEIAQSLGELIKLGLVESVHEDGQPVRYRLTGQPQDDQTEEPARSISPRRAEVVEAASALQIAA